MSAEQGAPRETAPAKLNLRLEVHGRRPDGFHELRTWMAAVDLCDRLEAAEVPRPGVHLRLEGPANSADIPSDERNLAVRAVLAGLERARSSGRRVPPGVELRLHKEIPSQAGLGGASSDAAAALRALDALLDRELGPEVREELLAELGSDCVFFERARASGLALCLGRGERVRPLPPLPADWRFLVLTPAIACPTPAVFAAWAAGARVGEPDRDGAPPGLPETWSDGTLERWLVNELEPAARVAVPELGRWLDGLPGPLEDSTRFVLTGSGSSVFALARSPQAARERLAAVRAAGVACRGAWILAPLAPARRV